MLVLTTTTLVVGAATLDTSARGKPGFPHWNPVPYTCLPIFTGFAYCGMACGPQGARGEACAVELYAAGEVPQTESVEAWWVVRGVVDGQRYYLYAGHFALGPVGRAFTLCDVSLGYDLEGYGWHEAHYEVYPELSQVNADVRHNECDDCRTPTPAPELPGAQTWPWDCKRLLYVPNIDHRGE
jgi:hypothetical protein